MSNSSLVDHVHYSPHHYSGRNHKIDTITIHCVVGQCSVESLGNVFDGSVEASSNYGIGYDGRIGLYVDESNAAWTSSNYANDNRAVTIEVASDVSEPYAVTDAAYNALIRLVADICRRNGIKKLIWSTNKNDRVNHLNGCNMTVHRDYANKSCPGTYLYNRHGEIAAAVNKLLGCPDYATESGTAATAPAVPAVKSAKPAVLYRVRSGGVWHKEVNDLSSYAGVAGKSITDVAIKVTAGAVKYRVHIKGGKWLPYVTGYDVTDSANGYAGNGKPIDAIEVYYTTPETIRKEYGGYLRAKYRVSPLNGSYYPYQYDAEKTNDQDGYAGAFGKMIDRLQITLSP